MDECVSSSVATRVEATWPERRRGGEENGVHAVRLLKVK